jgi:16S rRNA (adenine1518-N6/adenine1519-N6)-dimethyltransferase
LTTPKKALGQHFLFDPRILGRIADALDPVPDETVLEIGPGLGGLTAALASRTQRLMAIERDRELIPALRARFPEVVLAEGDALEMDWHGLVGPGQFSVIGNIPYNITTPLIDQALIPPRPRRVVFLVQREVADRLAARPGVPAYGALTVGVQSVVRVERLFGIPAGAFRPPPKVDSAVVRMTPLESPLISDEEVQPFRRFVVGLFALRRKQLGRALRQLLGVEAGRARELAAAAGLGETIRMETVAPAGFVTLFRAGRITG